MSSDDQNKSTVEQKPPDPEEVLKSLKKLVWDYLVQKLGWVVASVVFVTVLSTWSFHKEIAEVVSDLHAQIVQWWPLPKATPDVFTVALARLEGDDEKTHIEPTLAEDLQELSAANGIAVLEFHRTLRADSAAVVEASSAKAQKWLRQSGAQVLIWGEVLTANGKSVPKLYWTAAAGSAPKKPSDRYVLGEDLRLPPVFQSDLADILRLLVVTQSAAFNGEEGHFVADRLRPFIARVRRLLEGAAAKSWTAEDIARTKLVLGDALDTVGEQAGDNDALREAIGLYSSALEGLTRQRHPLDWAMTQNNLGIALVDLGERESGAQHLTEAVAAYHAALEERMRERVPLDWAQTQNNLGNALLGLGERESGTQHLTEAVAAYRAALQEYTQARVPLDWAATQNNLGIVLRTLGARESGTQHLNEAVVAYRAALQEYTQDRVPLDWAMTQNNLGNALWTLGARESGTQHLTEAVAAYRAALEEYTRERVPLDWATTQNNLGNTLWTLGERESGTQHLTEAVAAYRAALQERTQVRVPLDWAGTQNNLGNVLTDLGEREPGTQHLTEAVAAYRASLQERTQSGVPLDWAATQNNLGVALRDLGQRTRDTSKLCQALGDHVSAWQVWFGAAPHYASIAAGNAKADMDAIHTESPGRAPKCLQTYSAELKQMGVGEIDKGSGGN